MVKTLLLAICLCFAAMSASATTYYIDYSNGSNSNNGTSKTTPWKTHPYMNHSSGCDGASGPSYPTHVAGDQFIFKGNVTWPAACFTMNVTVGGTSIAQDYYGVDVTWYAGASFARPIFDMANQTASLGPIIRVRAAYITFDNLELKRLLITPGSDNCTESNIDTNSSNNGQNGVIYKNLYIHDWTTTAAQLSQFSHSTGSICTSGGSAATIDTVEMSDQNTTFTYNGSVMPFGACFRNQGEIKNSNCHHVGEGEVGHWGPIHDNQFHDMDGTAVTNAATAIGPCPPTGCTHTNGIEDSGFPSSGATGDDPRIYNNLIYNIQNGVTLYLGATAQVYNNVMWNNFNDDLHIGGGYACCTTGNFYNNTLVCTSGFACWGTDQKGGMGSFTVNLTNNIYITDGTAVAQRDTLAALNQITDYTMPTTEANSNGFTVANKYLGSSSDAHVAAAGTNLTTSCSGNLSALCSDTKGAPWYGGSYVTRPTGSTAWDLGAYVLGTPAPAPAVTWTPSTYSFGSIGVGSTLTNTFVLQNTGSATLNVSLSVSGTGFSQQSTTCGSTLTASASCNVVIQFAPSAVGSYSGTLTETDTPNSVSGSATFSGTGTSVTGCTTSDNLNWTNTAIAPQSATFSSVPFTITPDGTPAVGTGGDVWGLSSAGGVTTYSALSTIIRQDESGNWTVYKGGTGYTADVTVPWTVGTTATFVEACTWPAQTYTVTITQAGTCASGCALATAYPFRAAATSLGYWNLDPADGAGVTLTTCGFDISGTTLSTQRNGRNYSSGGKNGRAYAVGDPNGRTYTAASSPNNISVAQVCINTGSGTTSWPINIGATGSCANGSTPANPVAGHTVFVYALWSSFNVSTASAADTLSNTWTCNYNATNFEALCYSTLTTGGAADTVTITSGNGGSQLSPMISYELSGVNATPLDGSIQYNAIASGTSWSLPSVTTTNANDAVLACGGTSPAANVTFTAGSPWVISFGQYAGGSSPSGACEIRSVTSTGTYSPTMTVGTANAGSGLTVAIKSS